CRTAIPDHRGLALVRDADRLDRLRIDEPHRLVERAHHGLPDVFGIVLDPAGLGIDLAKLLVAAAANLQLFVEHEDGGSGGGLVDRDHVAHGRSRLCASRTCRFKNSVTSPATMSRSTSAAMR